MKKWLVALMLLCVCMLSISIAGFALTEEIEEYPGTNPSKYEGLQNIYSEREWTFANVGSNADGSYTADETSVVISPKEGKGKIADSEEGFCFYYTKVDATKENFYLKATFTITKVKADNQNGFGLICLDTVGAKNSGRYMNYVAAGCYKLGGSNYNIPGGRAVWGYLSPDGTSPSEDSAGLGESLRQSSVGAFSLADEHYPATKVGLTYTFVLRKSNTGYHAIMTHSPEGDGISEKVYYNADKLLSQQGDNPDEVYVGFFASRNVSVSVSDVFFATVDCSADERKYDEPPTMIPLQISVLSAAYRSGENYDYKMRANADGTLEVVDDEKNVYVQNVHVNADELFERTFALPDLKTVNLITRFYPDSSRIDAGVVSTYITKDVLPNVANVVYADPFVNSGEGSGTKNDPVNLADALSFALPGQVIVMKDGVYKPKTKIHIPRGVNGTEQRPIVFRSETVGGVTLDFSGATCSNEAVWLEGDYWYMFGFNVTRSPNSSKGIRVSGSHNVLERCKAYSNSNTGIQISGNSKESYACWPAYNLVKNCDSYDNCDETRQDADGFGVKLTVGDGNKLFGCVAYNNIDDGFDLYAKSVTGSIGSVTIENCVAYNNGYVSVNDISEPDLTGEGNGFKLGGESLPGKHKLVNSVAFGNGAKGITSNSCPDVIIQNCTVYNNNLFAASQGKSSENVSLYAKRSGQQTEFVVSGLISICNGAKADKFACVGQNPVGGKDNYVWNGKNSSNGEVTLSENIFENVNIASANISRNDNGELNMNGLLQLVASAPQNAGARIVADGKTEAVYAAQSTNIKRFFDELLAKIQQTTDVETKKALLAQWDKSSDVYEFLTEQDKNGITQARNEIVVEEESSKGCFGTISAKSCLIFATVALTCVVAAKHRKEYN